MRLQFYKVLLRTTKYYASTTQQFAPGATPRSDPKFAPEAIQKLRPKRPRAPFWASTCLCRERRLQKWPHITVEFFVETAMHT